MREMKRSPLFWAVIAIALFMVILPRVWSATVNVPVRMHFGETQDSIRVQIRAFNTVVGTFVKASTGLVDTIIPMGDDTLWQVYLRAYKAPDSARSWTYQLNRRYSQGPVEWPIEMYWAELTDSVRCKLFKDSIISNTFLITGQQSFDSSLTVNRGSGSGADTVYNFVADIYYQSQTIPASWVWNLEWRRLDTGQIIETPSANLCRLYAFIKLPSGAPARGALVTVTRGGAYNAISTSTTRYGITADATTVRTDTLGKFQIDVIASNQFADTANAYYNVSCKWKAIELFRVNHIWAPANTSLNVLDTLANR